MKKFNSLEELQNDTDLQQMSRYSWQIVKLNGYEVYACTTNQQYEDIIWGGIYEMLEQLCKWFRIENIDNIDNASVIRDYVLELLEEQGIKLVDVFDEY